MAVYERTISSVARGAGGFEAESDVKRSQPGASEARRKSVDALLGSSIPAGTLWICARCPYLCTQLPGGGHCPLCAALLIGQCACGIVIMGEEPHPCMEIRSA